MLFEEAAMVGFPSFVGSGWPERNPGYCDEPVQKQVQRCEESGAFPGDGEPHELRGSDYRESGPVVHGVPPKKSNLDATGMRIVRKGCVVEYPKSGCTARVVRVRLGQFWPAGKADGSPSFLPCSQVRVVA
jgi:hypothetical protein